MPLQVLHDRLCTALRGDRPRLVLEVFASDSSATLVFEDGSTAPGPPIFVLNPAHVHFGRRWTLNTWAL